MPEFRRYSRFRTELPASFETNDELQQVAMATTLDLSGTGLRLRSRTPLEVGRHVAVKLLLPGDERVVLKTKVVWIKEDGPPLDREFQIGLQLEDAMDDGARAFIRFVAGKMLDFYNTAEE